jgi:hypothetical protein
MPTITPGQRFAAIAESLLGQPRRDGRMTKEWLALAPTSEAGWLPLVQEAMRFVAAKP